jgi:hypothetical protein
MQVKESLLFLANQKKKKAQRSIWPSLKTRSSPAQLCSGIGKLTKHKRDCVRAMGFGKLLNLRVDSIPGKLGHYVVDHLDTDRMVLKTVKGEIKVDRESVGLLLGLPEGGIDTSTLKEQKPKTRDYVLWRKRYGLLDVATTEVVDNIGEDNYESDAIFKLDFLVLFITTMIECWQNGKCKYGMLKCLKDGTDISEYDWCGYIVDSIKKCKKKWSRDDKESVFVGPLTILTVCETVLTVISKTLQLFTFSKRLSQH